MHEITGRRYIIILYAGKTFRFGHRTPFGRNPVGQEGKAGRKFLIFIVPGTTNPFRIRDAKDR